MKSETNNSQTTGIFSGFADCHPRAHQSRPMSGLKTHFHSNPWQKILQRALLPLSGKVGNDLRFRRSS
jgi:hypothetical protein